MKKFAPLFIIIVLLLFGLSGCVWFNQIYPAPAEPYCQQAENSEVVLCRIFKLAQIEAEQANDLFLDASLLSIWTKIAKASQLRTAVETVKRAVVEKRIVTWDGLMAYATGDPALSLFLSRKTKALQNSPLGFVQFDDKSIKMLEYHFDEQLKQLAFF